MLPANPSRAAAAPSVSAVEACAIKGGHAFSLPSTGPPKNSSFSIVVFRATPAGAQLARRNGSTGCSLLRNRPPPPAHGVVVASCSAVVSANASRPSCRSTPSSASCGDNEAASLHLMAAFNFANQANVPKRPVADRTRVVKSPTPRCRNFAAAEGTAGAIAGCLLYSAYRRGGGQIGGAAAAFSSSPGGGFGSTVSDLVSSSSRPTPPSPRFVGRLPSPGASPSPTAAPTSVPALFETSPKNTCSESKRRAPISAEGSEASTRTAPSMKLTPCSL
mmetsp:Transcript_18774/g.46953  ORF Transcript_18774/g.46953 Transcript_18774/m.46953 type:complete len:276 (+) Transcript_18774:556-1383(+)